MVLPAILRIAKAHRVRRAARLAELGLHPGQDSVLLLLAQMRGCSMRELAAALGIKAPTITKTVGRLVSAGFVERREVAGDQRKAALDLTAAGEAAAACVEALWRALDSDALADFDPEAEAHLRHMLDRIGQNILRGAADGGGLDGAAEQA
ncbi:MarR family winged helix-turn-helix transcriptional regulator [Propylenella binzhouense]|nr:MarR family winged helix-turn-helix transcriptional regulator [Propylenella binzhouense]